MIARHSSLCPWCGVYIAKGRSPIRRLDRAIFVRPDKWALRLQGGWSDYDPASDFKARAWVHDRCFRPATEDARPPAHSQPVAWAPPPRPDPQPASPEREALMARLRAHDAADEERRRALCG